MPIKITRICQGPHVYEYGQQWPGAPKSDDELSQLVVGAIFERPEVMEDIPVAGDDGDEDGVPTEADNPTTETYGSHYEIWCVTHHVFVAVLGGLASQLLGGTFNVDKQKLAEVTENMIVTRRKIHVSKVDFVDEEMTAEEAFEEIILRLIEIEGGEPEVQPQPGELPNQPQPVAAQPTGVAQAQP